MTAVVPTTQLGRGSDYATLCRTVRAAGLLDRRLGSYSIRAVLALGFYVATVLAVVVVGDSWYQLIPAALFGLAYTHVAFLGHDAGHQQIFTSRRANDVVGRVLGNVLVGLSYGWWVDTHNRHHANPNNSERDPDFGESVLTFTSAQATDRTDGIKGVMARRQAWLFFPLLTLEGFSLHIDSVVAVHSGRYRSARGGSKRFEAIGLLLHAALYVTGLLLVMSPEKALAFVGVHQAVWGLYMGSVFAPNHKGMATIESGDDIDFLRRQVLTSRNVHGGVFSDFVLGGLNYQIEHHLFPNMPRGALRHAQPIVRAHCLALGVSYCETSLIGSYRAALGHLNEVGAPLRAARRALARGPA